MSLLKTSRTLPEALLPATTHQADGIYGEITVWRVRTTLQFPFYSELFLARHTQPSSVCCCRCSWISLFSENFFKPSGYDHFCKLRILVAALARASFPCASGYSLGVEAQEDSEVRLSRVCGRPDALRVGCQALGEDRSLFACFRLFRHRSGPSADRSQDKGAENKGVEIMSPGRLHSICRDY